MFGTAQEPVAGRNRGRPVRAITSQCAVPRPKRSSLQKSFLRRGVWSAGLGTALDSGTEEVIPGRVRPPGQVRSDPKRWGPPHWSSAMLAAVAERPPKIARRSNALSHASPTGNAVPLQVAARPFEGCRAFQRPVPGSPLLSRRGATVEVGVCHPTTEGIPVRHGNDGFRGRGSPATSVSRMAV